MTKMPRTAPMANRLFDVFSAHAPELSAGGFGVCVRSGAHTHKNERILVNEWLLFYCDFEVLPYLEGMPAELIVV